MADKKQEEQGRNWLGILGISFLAALAAAGSYYHFVVEPKIMVPPAPETKPEEKKPEIEMPSKPVSTEPKMASAEVKMGLADAKGVEDKKVEQSKPTEAIAPKEKKESVKEEKTNAEKNQHKAQVFVKRGNEFGGIKF